MALVNFDVYSLRARTLPMFIALFPLATICAAWTPGVLSLATGAAGATVLGGASFFASQLARNAGKRREPYLWRLWGGSPTTQLLRHRDGGLNPHQKDRYHAILRRLGEVVPTAQEEREDPRAADQRYDSCTRRLISLTRKQERFPLVFKENINFGFWRNLWALKPMGVTLALLALALCAAQVWPTGPFPFAEPGLVGGGIDVAILLVWIFWVSPDAVRIPAKAYAERLLEACTEL